MKTMAAVYCVLVSDPFSWGMKPTCIEINSLSAMDGRDRPLKN